MKTYIAEKQANSKREAAEKFANDLEFDAGDVKEKKNNNMCGWEYDRECGCYYTDCGNAHQFMVGDIKDNNYKYCPFCRKPIIETIGADK